MPTTRIVLRKDKPGANGFCPVDLIYSVSGQREHYRTDIKLHPLNWYQKEQKIVTPGKPEIKAAAISADLLPTRKEIEQIELKIAAIKKTISDIESRFELDRVKYTSQMVVEALKAITGGKTRKTEPPGYLYGFIDKYITDNEQTRVKGSLSVYKSLKRHLQGFEQAKNVRVLFENINYAFFSDFQNYLLSIKQTNVKGEALPLLNNITVAKILSTLKTFIGYAKQHGVYVSDNYKAFKLKKEPLEVIALTDTEFQALYSLDLSAVKRLDKVRDIFIFSCCTGLRYSDLKQLKHEHINGDEIRLTTTKTKEIHTIPLTGIAIKILSKYQSMAVPLPVMSNVKLNEYLKEVCELSKINTPVQIVRFRGAKREETTYKKFELITIHSGRKTFATLSLEKGMSAEEVMKVGGWKSYNSFKRYINITEKRVKNVMLKAWDNNTNKLKAV